MITEPLKLTDELFLYSPSLDFSKALFELVSKQRSYLQQWMGWMDNIQSEKHAERFFRELQLLQRGGYQYLQFLILDGHLVGSVGLVKIRKKHQIAEMGYWIAREYQGKGWTTLANQKIVDLAFQKLNIRRLEIKCIKENQRSQLIPQRLGFKHEGTLRSVHVHRGVPYDLEVYSLLKSEWLDKTNKMKEKI